MNKYNAMRFAARPVVVGKLLADMYGVLCLLMLVPTAIAVFTNSPAITVYFLLISGLSFTWFLGRRLSLPLKVQRNEALIVVALLFTSSSVLLSLPVMAYGFSFSDAWFEAVSGITTTGLSTLALDNPSPALLFSRAWMQWVGGIGVVVLALAVFVKPGVTANRLGFSEQEMDDVVGGTRAHAKRVIVVYLCLTSFGIISLYLSGASLLDAICHSMAAISTGGFANYSDSLASMNNIHLIIVNALCIAGAISFHLYYRSLLHTGRGSFLSNQLYSLLALLLFGACVMWLLLWNSGASLDPRDVITLVVSAQTTAGFSTINVAALPSVALLALCVFMAIGGGAGSTSGGIKMDRVLLILQIAKRAVTRTALPDQVKLGGSRVGDIRQLEDAITLVFLFFTTLVISWLIFVAYGFPALPALFEVTSALATVGLSAGITSEALPSELKMLLCFNMLLGRLEIIAALVMLAPRSWIGRRRKLTRRDL